MMHIAERFCLYLSMLDKNEFYRRAAIFMGIIILGISLLLFFYYNKISSIQDEMQNTNKVREKVQEVLKRLKVVKQQSTEMNNLLAEDKSFKIQDYFDKTIDQLHLSKNQVGEPTIPPETILKRYTEIKLSAHLTQLNTKQLTQLLSAIEQKKRVSIKDLNILHKDNMLDVTLTIATLKPHDDVSKKT